MKTRNTISVCLYMLMFAIYPALILPGLLREGYHVAFTLWQKIILAAVFLLGTASVWTLLRKQNVLDGVHLVGCLFCAFGSVLYLANIALFLWIGLIDASVWLALPILVPFFMIAFLLFNYLHPMWLKVTSIIVSVLLSAIISFVLFFTVFFALFPLGVSTVLRTVDSPDGNYCAYLIVNDAGATGGSTDVGILRKGDVIHLGLCDYKPNMHYVFSGSWGSQNSITIEWKDNKTVVINGTQYSVRP